MSKLSLSELTDYLNKLLNSTNIPDSSINGIQVTNTTPIKKIVTAVSASLDAIEKAIQLQAQVLIVHHGIFVKNDSYPIVETKYRKIKALIENNIALLCYHLPLDAHRDLGNNWKAARDLGLQNLEPFAEYQGNYIGVIGSTESISFDALKKQTEQYYQNSAHAIKVKDPIKRIAIVSGGADKLIMAAAHAGADCFITGRVDEPVWDNAHEENISFLALGHYATETIGVKALAEHLQEKFNITCSFIRTKNPY